MRVNNLMILLIYLLCLLAYTSIITNIIIIIIIINNTVPIAPDIIGTVLEPLAVGDAVVGESGVLILVVPVDGLVAEI